MIDERCAQDAWLRGLHHTWLQQGLDADRLFAEADLDLRTSANEAPTVLSDKLSRLWELAVQATGDPLIGVKSAPQQPLGSLGLVAHLILACSTVREALACLCDHVSLVLPTATARLEATPNLVRLQLHLAAGERAVPPQRYDCVAALVLRVIQWLIGRPLLPRMIHHPLPAGSHAARYAELFGAPVRFGQPFSAMDFDPVELEVPLPTANPVVAEWCARLTADIEQSRRGQLRVRVKKVLVELLPKGDPRREDVAEALHMSERTLQRRLSEEGTHFQELVDATRRELAQQFLSAGRLSPKEMSFELGFADPSNFYRACKRWFGQSPKMLRFGPPTA
ncbi:MAG: AraC family transcriptional regulator [Pseudomonadota bacterium]